MKKKVDKSRLTTLGVSVAVKEEFSKQKGSMTTENFLRKLLRMKPIAQHRGRPFGSTKKKK